MWNNQVNHNRFHVLVHQDNQSSVQVQVNGKCLVHSMSHLLEPWKYELQLIAVAAFVAVTVAVAVVVEAVTADD